MEIALEDSLIDNRKQLQLQSSLEKQHGIRFTLGDNQRVIDMDAKGAAERRAVKHEVKGVFEHVEPTTGRTYRTKEKVSEEYQIEEKKFHQPGQTNDVPSTTE